MNRNFLIFLMVATALMIAVIGREPTPEMPGYLPWDVKPFDDGKIRVFGLTLGKTRIQDANQIISTFPDSRLITKDDELLGLYAIYEEVNMAGFVAQLRLEYDVDQETLIALKDNAMQSEQDGYYRLSNEQQMKLLDSTVKTLHYLPYIDYDADLVMQHFGQPDEKINVSDSVMHWLYLDKGITIIINDDGKDEFIYRTVNASKPKNQ